MLICLAVCTQGLGQTITGMVTDKSTQQPVSGALVIVGINKTYTNVQGLFQIAAAGDSLKIIHFAYKTYTTGINKNLITLHIELEPAVIALNTVTVHGDRDFRKDSISNRQSYAKQFNYVGPKVMDAFKGNAYNRQPGELISINPLLLIAALTKKSTPEYKFHQILLRDEHQEYIDRKFNNGNVSRITALKGDTLTAFMIRYRPTFQFAQKATQYDMELYIKDSFIKFKKEGLSGTDLFKDVANKEPVRLN